MLHNEPRKLVVEAFEKTHNAKEVAEIHNIDLFIQKQPDITIHEILDKLQLRASDETVRKAVLKCEYQPDKTLCRSSPQQTRH